MRTELFAALRRRQIDSILLRGRVIDCALECRRTSPIHRRVMRRRDRQIRIDRDERDDGDDSRDDRLLHAEFRADHEEPDRGERQADRDVVNAERETEEQRRAIQQRCAARDSPSQDQREDAEEKQRVERVNLGERRVRPERAREREGESGKAGDERIRLDLPNDDRHQRRRARGEERRGEIRAPRDGAAEDRHLTRTVDGDRAAN